MMKLAAHKAKSFFFAVCPSDVMVDTLLDRQIAIIKGLYMGYIIAGLTVSRLRVYQETCRERQKESDHRGGHCVFCSWQAKWEGDLRVG
jgi:hypothetical protein